ncbi:glycoside hydrolase family 13 protein [Dothistroma septosporum NZE10]|uniref:Glycoside hydrolase family 13 protein n=1 Tax=Dothistroma septosporum (strain NZE10 / CBS 128990) TaxID=675120 RepID=N1Q4J5_DOTSN|nr:glycoside hydrolase family 13 protein [Dothistroma septosporum NZE10]
MTLMQQANAHRWWKEAVVYQVYPASFLHTGAGSQPGWGDVQGIISKLDYLKHLGVDVVWTSPIFLSPQADMGYDISDYKDIDPKYGSLKDVDNLIAGLKQRGMRLMMDLVVNHTSEQHAWFLDSRSSKNSKYRDWYIWKDPKVDKAGKRQPPNNWSQILGDANSAWTWDEHTQQYYLSLFTPEQPDLNWENPDVRAAVHDVLRFWLERGASGFRMDVINLISKVQDFPDAEVTNPKVKYQSGHKFFANGPRLHEFLKNMNQEVLSNYDSITVGEMPYVIDQDEILRVVGEGRKELNMIFIFEIVDVDNIPGGPRLTLHDWTVKDLRTIVSKWQNVMRAKGGWNSVFIENHDNPRSVSRYVSDANQEVRELGAKLLATMQTTLSGTLYVYQGEEIGMGNVPLSWSPDEYKDIESINYWKKMNDLYENDEKMLKFAKEVLQKKARDHARTPVQWTAGANAGFCKDDIEPWMRVNDDYRTINAEAQREFSSATKLSVLQHWRRALENRKKEKEVFIYGDFELLDDKHETIFAYRRSSKDKAFVTVLNFSDKQVDWHVPRTAQVQKWVAGNYTSGAPEKDEKAQTIQLKPWEAILGIAAV